MSNVAPLSILHTVAGYYARDARDFLERFNILWERQLHKTGRIKSFVDLLLACECALKCHIVLVRLADDPCAAYREARRYGHDIGALSAAATLMRERTIYNAIIDRLAPFSVFIRYSLDAYEIFFPSALERDEAAINHSRTIGNNRWVLECRDLVASLLDATHASFEGFITTDVAALVQHERDMKKFAEECMRL